MSKRSNIANVRLANYARKHGIKGNIQEIVEFAEKQLGITPPAFGETRSKLKSRLIDAMRVASGEKPYSKGGTKKVIKKDKTVAFYKSYQWRAVRYDVLEKNDGRCECCGQGKHEGIILHVDHIKPLRANWKLRLDPNNLQVLCNECNHGKGNRYETDWRKK